MTYKRFLHLINPPSEAEMIILFGSYACGDWVEYAYEEDGVLYHYQSDYDFN